MLSFNCTVTYKKSPYKTIGIIIDQYGARNSDGSKLVPGQYTELRNVRNVLHLLEFLSDKSFYDISFDKNVTDSIYALTLMDSSITNISSYDFDRYGQYTGSLKKIPTIPQDFFDAFGLEIDDMQGSGVSSYLTYAEDALQNTIENTIDKEIDAEDIAETPSEVAETPSEVVEVAPQEELTADIVQEAPQEEVVEDTQETAQEAVSTVKKTRAPKKARYSTKDIKEDENESTEIGEQQ